MCDCAETFHKKRSQRSDDDEAVTNSRPPPPEHSKAAVLALSALLCGLVGFLLYSLDRRTVKKILTMLGLGFLFAQPTTTKPEASRKPCIPKPNPCLKRPDPVESKAIPESPGPKPCKCKENKPPSDIPPPPPPSCRPAAPPPTCVLPPAPPEKNCKCCPNS